MAVIKEVLGIEFPNYIIACVPYFIAFFVAEQLLSVVIKKKDDFNLRDSFSSLATGLSTIIYEKLVPSTLLKTTEFIGVIYIWLNYRIVDIPEDSKLASLACFILIDFGYYWFHRLAHEVNYMWATHVTHHSSEKYNLTTALRQSVFQPYTSWIFFLPLGFFMPPQMFFFHKQFNTIYQFWIHTTYIGKLGPIEWIFNTPSHHRVHHGRNPKYIDKNYAGTLIIWDRLFGTFQEEDEEVYYGLVHPLGSSDPTWSQIHHWYEMYQNTKNYPNLSDKIKIYLHGPGWKPGQLKSSSVLPVPHKGEVEERIGTGLPISMNAYLVAHFMLMSILSIVCITAYEQELGKVTVTLTMAYLYFSLTTFGFIFDKKKYAMTFELIRLALFITFTWDVQNNVIQYVRLFYFISSAWVIATHFSELSLSKSKLKYI